jgi:hypothetical protein
MLTFHVGKKFNARVMHNVHLVWQSTYGAQDRYTGVNGAQNVIVGG